MTFLEKTAILVLSGFMVVGLILLYVRDSRTGADISITHDGIKRMYSLEEISCVLAEKNKVCVNTASVDELVRIPEVGPETARRIVEYRDANGPFSSVEQFLEIKGIGEKKLEKMKDMIRFR